MAKIDFSPACYVSECQFVELDMDFSNKRGFRTL